MPCACSLPARTSAPSRTEVSTTSNCALEAKNATPRRRLCAPRAFNLAILLIMFLSWPLLVHAEAEQAGSQGHLEPHRQVSELNVEAFLQYRQRRSGERSSSFGTRKFLRQGTESGDEPTEELPLQLSDHSEDGFLLSPDHEHIYPGRHSSLNRRMLIPANACTNKDISISQGPDGSSGIPRYFVQIVNTCMSDCAPSQVHVYCGWFASAFLVNPNTFQRLAYNDCLVNGGRPLKYGEIIIVVATISPEDAEGGVVCSCVKTKLSERLFLAMNECTNKDISITQRRDGSPGIPRFSVQIVNTCMSDCAPADIHVYCGWFASSPPPNPNIFQRISYNDCLVNGGRPLGHGAIIQFQYANSFMYPIRFRSARFCR